MSLQVSAHIVRLLEDEVEHLQNTLEAEYKVRQQLREWLKDKQLKAHCNAVAFAYGLTANKLIELERELLGTNK